MARSRPKKQGLSLEDLPTIHDKDPLASLHHDRYLYGLRPERRKR